jgi:Carboxypeptidase regulatory-like domain
MRKHLLFIGWFMPAAFGFAQSAKRTNRKFSSSLRLAFAGPLALFFAGLLIINFGSVAFAQSPTGTIRGTVIDPTGAQVGGATITLTNVATNASQTATTDNAGRYILNFVPPGTYSETASAAGFRTAKQNNIIVEIAVDRPVDFKLEVGLVSSQVEVTSTTPPLETSSSNIDTVITTKEITDLPLNGRNPFTLVETVPGVSTVGNASTPHIAGSRNANNEEQLDGMTNILPENNVGNNSTAYTPIVDSVSEFNVQTSVLPAQFGRFSGGVINMVTKTGTNQLHGGAFAFAQTTALGAKNYFSSGPVPPYYQYQWGGTLGGPIVIPHVFNGHNRTFFFVGYQDTIEADDKSEVDSVPLPAWRSGDFSSLPALSNGSPGVIYDPATATLGTDGFYHRTPFAGNIIPLSRLSAVSQAAMKYYPMPNHGAPGAFFNNYQVSGSESSPTWQFDVRLDHNFTDKWHSFVKLSHQQGSYIPFNDYGNPAALTGNGPTTDSAYSFSFDNAITLSPTLVMDLRAGFSRSTAVRTAIGEPFNLSSIDMPPSYISVSQMTTTVFPYFNVGNGYSGLGSTGYVPLEENPSAFDFNPSVVKTIHGHSITVGGEWRKIFENFYQYGFPSGQFAFSQDWTQAVANNTGLSGGTGNAFASMMLGLGDSGSITHDIGVSESSAYFALFLQDDYQASKRLTFNVGLRWDVDIPRTERHNRLDYWNPNLPSPLVGVPAGACLYCANLKGQMIFVGTPQDPYGRHQGPTQWRDFGPRAGFAWSADDKTVVRGGYAVIFQPSELQAGGTTGGSGTDGFTSQTNFNFTFNNQQTIATTIDNPAPTGYNLPLGVAGGPLTYSGLGISDTFFSSYRNPYSIEANLNIQRAIPGNATVEVAYLYNRGNFLINGDPGVPFGQVNPSYLSLGTQLTASVPNPFYGIITTQGSPLAAATVPYDYLLAPFPNYNGVTSFRKATSGSHYNAFTAKLNKRFSQGFSTLFSFTAGKLMDNASSVVSYLGPTSQTYNNQYNPAAEFGLSSQDVSRILTVAGVYELPFGRGKLLLSNLNAVADKFIGGWQANTIVQWDSGTPVVLGSANDNSGLLGSAKRPAEAPGNAKLGNSTMAHYFNTALFSQPAPFTLGNAPRVLPNVRVPGVVNADISAFKNNYIGSGERYNIQFRVEAFNALNHPQFNAPDSGVNDGTFGEITGSQGQANTPRRLQLVLKLIW